MFNKKSSMRLYCFSPPVMIATFVLEVAGALWVWLKYKTDKLSRIIIALLVFLALFQLAEANVCEGWMGLTGDFWSRLGFISISMLPPLGVHLAVSVLNHQAKKPRFTHLPMVAYSTGALFIGFFLFGSASVVFDQCLGNYVIFKVGASAAEAYGLYYYGWLLVGVWLCFWAAKKQAKALRQALNVLGLGYLLFMLPTTAVNLIDPTTIDGIPSIMCGFAVLLAVTLVAGVAPRVLKQC